jgi:isochorismate synthase
MVRPRPEHSRADLLKAYLPGSFFYSSPGGCLLADGVRARVEVPAEGRSAAVAEALAAARDDGHPDPVVVGALGFEPDAPSTLVVPSVVRWAGLAAGNTGRRWPDAPGAAADWTVEHEPTAEGYAESVQRALELIDAGVLEKVVLSRRVRLSADRPVEVPLLLERLVHADPMAHAFAVDVSTPADDAIRTLLGASPELLVNRRGEVVITNPLAGSAPRSADPAEDHRRAQALLHSEKDRHEHGFVVDQIGEVLGRYCGELVVPAEPHIIGTATMWHLSSRISGRLVDRGVPALDLAEALHPTPAVCGVPLAGARTVIGELEDAERGYYSGLVGWSAEDGDGEWVVTIRCAEAYRRTLTLYAGAGVVDGSSPEAELAETTAKLRTLLRAIGTSEAL